MKVSDRVVLGRLTLGAWLNSLEKYCPDRNLMESSTNHSGRRSLRVAIGLLFASGVIACTAGEAVAIPVGSLNKPEPAPLAESSYANARLGLGPSSEPCLSRARPRRTPGQQTL